jgi:hypothetical protein
MPGFIGDYGSNDADEALTRIHLCQWLSGAEASRLDL